MDEMKIDSKFADQSGEIMVVELNGHVDQSNSHQLEKMFDNILKSGCYRVIVDFEKLYYMSSAGWGIFVGEIKRFRDNGGDIKLASMNPEIYDVYQMLEFYHILDDFPNVEDATKSFRDSDDEIDLVLAENEDGPEDDADMKNDGPIETSTEEIDITGSDDAVDSDETAQKKKGEVLDFTSNDLDVKEQKKDFIPHTVSKDVKLSELRIQDKIQRVVAENPVIGIFGIRKILQHEQFGETKISIIKVFQLLRSLDLETKAKRYRYYRSC